MRFRRDAPLDTSQVTDVRGRRPSGLALGGGAGGLGIVGVLIFLAITLLSGNGGGLGQLGALNDEAIGQGNTPSEIRQDCRTGEDANTRDDCRIVGVVNDVQKFWAGVFRNSNRTYQPVNTVFFTGSVDTGCGAASSAVGPFYCPEDKLVYIDLGFFDDVKDQLGVEVTPFVQAYVLAHEYGHHVQDQLGVLDAIRGDREGPESKSVRSELQADCYAGVWAHYATTVEDENGEVFITDVTQDDINRAIDAATAVGDDRIQQRTQGHVNEEQWTHGSAEERVRWFTRGYQEGTIDSCDTFSASSL
jgi:predicted metalloprotease